MNDRIFIPRGSTTVEPGIYRHFKGNEYEVIGMARHTETDEPLVVYRPVGDGKSDTLWVRPYAMFIGDVGVDGTERPRFARIR